MKFPPPKSYGSAAFTFVEFIFLLAGVCLLVLFAMPLLGNTRTHADRMACVNNLRQVGVAFHLWGDSHDDLVPWKIAQGDGGTATTGTLMNLAWYHFSALSNSLPSPALLACPADDSKVAARWDQSGDGGFLNPSYRNNALSYLVGCHAETRLPLSVLAADRNIIPDGVGASCALGFTQAILVQSRATRAVWNGSNMHKGTGNLLAASGSVVELSWPGLQQYELDLNSDNGAEHYLVPR